MQGSRLCCFHFCYIWTCAYKLIGEKAPANSNFENHFSNPIFPWVANHFPFLQCSMSAKVCSMSASPCWPHLSLRQTQWLGEEPELKTLAFCLHGVCIVCHLSPLTAFLVPVSISFLVCLFSLGLKIFTESTNMLAVFWTPNMHSLLEFFKYAFLFQGEC